MRRFVPGAVVLAVAAVIAVLPFLMSDFRSLQGAYVGAYFCAILGLNILTGYTGQISLGHGAFMAIGGYTTAILAARHGWPYEATLPVAGLIAGAAGIVVGIPALRLSGVYLALGTFALAVSVPSIAKKYASLTGGTSGIILPFLPGRRLYAVAWTCAAVLFVIAWVVLRGRVGRAFRAIRDSEVAAISSGVSLPVYKTFAFAISAAFAGVAGGVYALAANFANPDTFPITLSLYILIGAVVGGLGSLWGVVLGALFVEVLPIWAQTAPVIGSKQAPAVIYGIVLIAIMFLLPTGFAGLLGRLAGRVRRQES